MYTILHKLYLLRIASRRANALIRDILLVFVIIIYMLVSGCEKESSHSKKLIATSTERREIVHPQTMSESDKQLVEMIEEIGKDMEISHTIIREAKTIVNRPNEEKAYFRELLFQYDPRHCRPYSKCWKKWFDFGMHGDLFPQSPAMKFSEKIADIIAG